jgi:hypothetical protein
MTPSKAPLPLIGTWKLTGCESSRPDLPHPTSGTAKFSQEEDGIHYLNEVVWSNGHAISSTVAFHLDGAWYPVAGAMMHDAMSSLHLEDGSFEMKMQKGGVYVGRCRSSVSQDGKVLTGQWEFPGPGGTAVTWTTTSERL